MRRFSEGMIVRHYTDDRIYRITKVTDKEVFYKPISFSNWETREDIDFFSSLAPENKNNQKYRFEVIQ